MAVEAEVLTHIRTVLQKFGYKYLTKQGTLKKSTVIEDLDKYEPKLLTAILNDKLLHDTYTTKIADVEIFEINKFVDLLHYKEYWQDSLTKFDNKIGLTVNGKYLNDDSDVVLDFPYKDAVLKADMKKEKSAKGAVISETFLNETLAKSEIDELLEPKVLINAQKYSPKNVRGGGTYFFYY